jgi:hypothetical protein
MDSHGEILRRSRVIVRDSQAVISRWATDKITTRSLLRSARERIFNSQEALQGAVENELIPFSWFKPVE